jgi:formamidopyrimidine-DNA glycosylase
MLHGKFVHEIIPLEGGRYGSFEKEREIVGLDAYCDENNGIALADGHAWAYGQPINEVGVKGKFMWWGIGDWFLWCTYGMSGQWSTKYDPKHSACQVCYNDSADPIHPCSQTVQIINFNDPRHFGTLKLVKGRPALLKKLASLGPDMLNSPPAYEEFLARLTRKHHVTVAQALMDQSCISGVGNYIKAEALYLAEISPHRYTDTLTANEMKQLREQIINVMQASYNNDGVTIRSYLNVDGSKGGMKTRFLVYGNKTDPLGNPVVKEETKDGRTTHWVPAIQK